MTLAIRHVANDRRGIGTGVASISSGDVQRRRQLVSPYTERIVHIPKKRPMGWFTILAIASCLLPFGNARASVVTDLSIILQVASRMNTPIGFSSNPNTLSLSTGQVTIGDYTISNITAEFVGPGFPNVIDPLQVRLTGIASITCVAPC